MKIEVGMYVRTNDGLIFKIKNIVKTRKVIVAERDVFDNYELKTDEIDIEELIKWYEPKYSFNLIDLIEVGDYVNGLKIEAISKDPFIKGQTNVWTNQIYYDDLFGTISKVKFTDNNIKSILTHEQYEANCYKVVE